MVQFLFWVAKETQAPSIDKELTDRLCFYSGLLSIKTSFVITAKLYRFSSLISAFFRFFFIAV